MNNLIIANVKILPVLAHMTNLSLSLSKVLVGCDGIAGSHPGQAHKLLSSDFLPETLVSCAQGELSHLGSGAPSGSSPG